MHNRNPAVVGAGAISALLAEALITGEMPDDNTVPASRIYETDDQDFSYGDFPWSLRGFSD